ncbi:invasion associated locus B family protein [Plastoroseomonas arctica]|uniref:Invasion associated locus B family protein n=1 Tax=Plastoroseomonas arctica TaxID=1509237 RepID=A0AAF1KNW3_9PROT|nr:invasion associated locus B family protein [Plastoroseomonas arctica]MBR0655108.1 invasion associated locus B family protein [Plastoroseomonas arctica]
MRTLTLLGFLFLAAPALAQPAPERTLAAFGDWVVRCERVASGRSCEMAQTMADQRQQPVAVVAFARGTPLRIVVQVPVNIAVAEPARLTVEPALVLPFRSCVPQGCFAELALSDAAVVTRMRARAADASARLEWRDPAGTQQMVPVSFRGFSDALDALNREAP